MSASTALAIDLGGTRIKAGVVVEHDVVAQRIVPTEDDKGFDRVLQNIIAVSDELLRERPATAIGVCLPGVVDVSRGMLVDVRKNLLGLIGFPLAEVLQERFGIPVAVENDARLYGLGELVAGAARGSENMVCLTLGTGVGCCVAMEGHVLRGRHGTTGVLGGHMTIEADGLVCNCGNIGCVETRCSASAMLAAMTARLARRPDHRWHTVPALSAEMIVAAATDGDDLAGEVLAEYVHYLSAAVVSYIHVYDPDVVVLGGGLMNAGGRILPPIEHYVYEHTWSSPPRQIPVRAAELGDRAALVGAAALAQGFSRFR